MKLTAKDLVKLLEPLKLGNGKLSTGIQSGYVVVSDNIAYTFSGDIYAQITLPDTMQFGGPEEGCTPYKSLVDMIKKYDGKEVTINVQDNKLVIASGRSRTRLTWETDVCVPRGVVGDPIDTAWKPLPKYFATAIKECEEVVDVRRECSLLSTVHVTPSFIEAASPARVVRCKCALDIEQDFLFNAGQLSTLFDYPLTEYQVVDPRWFFVRGNNIMFGIPMHFEPYLEEMDALFSKPGKTFILDGVSVSDIKLAQAILDKGKQLNVTIKDGKCVISGVGYCGSHLVEADVDTQLDDSFSISPVDLCHILDRTTVCTLGEKTLGIETDDLKYIATIERKNLK